LQEKQRKQQLDARALATQRSLVVAAAAAVVVATVMEAETTGAPQLPQRSWPQRPPQD
jgi:hypothetical protein